MSKGVAAVVGATGTQGSLPAPFLPLLLSLIPSTLSTCLSVVRALAAAGYTVRALTRSPNSNAAQSLFTSVGENVKPTRFDLNDSSSVREAFTGADVVFALSIPEDDKLEAVPGTDAAKYDGLNETEQGLAMAEIASQVKVGCFIWYARLSSFLFPVLLTDG